MRAAKSRVWVGLGLSVVSVGLLYGVYSSTRAPLSGGEQARLAPVQTETEPEPPPALAPPGERAEEEGHEDPARQHEKNRRWTREEARARRSAIARRKQVPAQRSAFAEGALLGSWSARGPYNQPGCWEMAEVVREDNSVYGVTCGHYGGSQFIFQGTLEGDDFQLISGRMPVRYDAIFAFDRAGQRRVLVQISEGGVAYSDDGGQTWPAATGLPEVIDDLVVQRSDEHTVYASDGRVVFRSTDGGASFSSFVNFDDEQLTRLYSPRYPTQPGHDRLFMARLGEFYEITDDGAATLLGSFPVAGTPTNFALGGDTRKLYARVDNQFFTSTDTGASWELQAGTMSAGRSIGVHPEDPEIVIGGYLNPTLSWDGMGSVLERNWWGQHQVGPANTPDDRHHAYLHADNQSTQFFYDSFDRVLVMHSSDGGLYISYKEWEQDLPDSGAYSHNVFANITLFGTQSAEIYPSAMVTGARSPYDIVTGTQDQGTQTVETRHAGEQSFLQAPYGDGPHIVSADGETAWSYSYTAETVSAPYPLYDEEGSFTGVSQRTSAHDITLQSAWYFHDAVADVAAPGERLWILSQRLQTIEWDGATLTSDATLFGDASAYVGALAQAGPDPDWVFLIKQGELFYSSDRGQNWSGRSTGIVGKEDWDRCGLWLSPVELGPLLVLCPSGNEVVSVYSPDGGQTIVDVSGSMPNTAVGGMVGEPSGRFVFASTSLGPFVFDVEAQRWYDLAGDDVPWFDGRRVEYIAATESVRFSTWGSGIWDFQIGGCDDTVEVEAGPIANFEQAQTACPALCVEGEWTGHWWETEPQVASICQCCAAEEPPTGGSEDTGEEGSDSAGEAGSESGDEQPALDGDSGCNCGVGVGGEGSLPWTLGLFGLLVGLRRPRRCD